MIIGIGTDIIEISRIQKAVENKSFLSKIYTKSEQQLFHNCNYETLAGNFAAKEAVVKAMGTGFNFKTRKWQALCCITQQSKRNF